LASRQRDHQRHRIATMLFDPRASAKPANAIAVEQRRLGERLIHIENVTGFNAPSNHEKVLFYQAVLLDPPSNSPTKSREEPKSDGGAFARNP
jgi:hypothetical protein